MAADAMEVQARREFDAAHTLGAHDRLKAARQALDDALVRRAGLIDTRITDQITRLARRAGLTLTESTT